MAIASAIPLLRGGDLPGVYAFIGMTFWPILIFINRYKKFLNVYNIEQLIASRRYLQSIQEQKEKEIEVTDAN